MRGKLRLIVFTSLSLLVGVVAFILAKGLRVRAQELNRSPFTAFFTENQYPAGQAQPDRSEYYLRAFRSDGTQVTLWRRASPSQEWMEPKVILDLRAGKRITVDSFTESLTSYPLSQGTVAFYQSSPKTECTDKANFKTSTLLGYEVRKITKDLAERAGRRTSIELLEAPGLDCFPLEEDWTLSSSEGPDRKIVRQALLVIKGEPESSLFEVPKNYTERSPSQVAEEFVRRYPDRHLFPPATAQHLDDTYEKAQQSNR